jgi:LmbE family N-acetylglucosaminyl deacetylase
MVIVGHPQDPFERSAGTVAKHLAPGDEAMFVSVTTGVVTHAFDTFPATGDDKLKDIEKVKDTKRDEFDRAAKVLGLTDGRVLDFPESPMLLGMEEYVTVVDMLREFRPDVVICPHPVEVGRQDHMDAGRFAVACVDYVRADGFPSPLAPHTVPHVFMFYYPGFNADQLMGTARHQPDVVVDITSVIDKKRAAMAESVGTQAKSEEDYAAKTDSLLEHVDGHAGYMNKVGYAEQFTRLNRPVSQYLPLGE